MQGAPLLNSAPTTVADRMFFKSFASIRSGLLLRALFFLLQSVTLGGLLVYTIVASNQQSLDLDYRITNAFIIMIVVSVYGCLVRTMQFRLVYCKPAIYLAIAQATNHLVDAEQIRGLQSFEECTSQFVYSGQTMQREDEVPEQARKLLERITVNSIVTTVKLRIRFVRSSESTLAVLSVVSLIYDIVVMATVPVTTLQIIVFSVYSAIVVFSELLLILLLISFALLPLLCFFGCIYFCCKKTASTTIDVPQIEATANDIVNVGGDCSICFQSIGVNEKIYVLRCSEKHVFHCSCLNAWAKVKPNCPICRQEIPTKDNP